ncbi:hypothetical protein ACRTDR_20170, partial [Shewanella algae]
CKMWTSRMVLDLVVFWRNQLDQSTPCVSTELNKKGIIWGFPRLSPSGQLELFKFIPDEFVPLCTPRLSMRR